jgi:cell division protein FtsW
MGSTEGQPGPFLDEAPQGLRAPDPVLIIAALLLVAIGLANLWSLREVPPDLTAGATDGWFLRHFLTILAGIAAFRLFSRLPYQYLAGSAHWIIGTGIVLGLASFGGLGSPARGLYRWVRIGGLSFAPTGFIQLATLIYASAWLSSESAGRSPRPRFFPGFVLLLLPGALFIFQPNFSALIVLVISVFTLAAISEPSGRRTLSFATAFTIVVLPMLFVGGYQFRRITSFVFGEGGDASGLFSESPSVAALGSGDTFGVGAGHGLAKYGHLQFVNSTYLLTNHGEEYGFIGMAVIIILGAVLLVRGYRIGLNARTALGRRLAIGLSSWLAIQYLANLAIVLGLLPQADVQAPLVSTSGSMMLAHMIALGVIANIGAQSGIGWRPRPERARRVFTGMGSTAARLLEGFRYRRWKLFLEVLGYLAAALTILDVLHRVLKALLIHR